VSAPLREQFANEAQDTLDGGINNSVTSLDVHDGSEFPSVGNFRIRIENEILICTARSGETLTVLRGQEGTTGASHSDSSVVTHILTTASVNRWMADNVAMAGLLPVFKIVADDGSTLLTASDFTWRNQAGSSRADEGGSIVLLAPAHGAISDDQRILERTAPSPPYSYIAAFRGCFPLSDTGDLPSFGLGLLENSTGKNTCILITATNASANGYRVTTFATPSGGVAHHEDFKPMLFFGPEVWCKVEDDNTNVKFYIGDGLRWVQVWSAGRTSQMAGGPDRVFWYSNPVGSDFENFVRLLHWSRAS